MTHSDKREYYLPVSHGLHDGVSSKGAKTHSLGGEIDDISFGNRTVGGLIPLLGLISRHVLNTLAGSIPARANRIKGMNRNIMSRFDLSYIVGLIRRQDIENERLMRVNHDKSRHVFLELFFA